MRIKGLTLMLQGVPDQGLPLFLQGVPYKFEHVPQLLTVQQQPSSYYLEWALVPCVQPCKGKGKGRRTDLAAGKYPIWYEFGPSTQGEHVDSTQGVFGDSPRGYDFSPTNSDSEDAPEDVTCKGKGKQKVQTYNWNHGNQKNLRTIKEDRRGGISLLYMATAHSVARRRGLTRTHRSPLARSNPQRYQFPSASARSNPNTPNEQRGKRREPRPIPTHPLLIPSHCRTSSH